MGHIQAAMDPRTRPSCVWAVDRSGWLGVRIAVMVLDFTNRQAGVGLPPEPTAGVGDPGRAGGRG